MRCRILLVAAAAILAAQFARADSPSVTAVLSNSEVAVGEITQLEIRIAGARGAKPPQEIAAEGLEIKYAGEATESQITFGLSGLQSTSIVTYAYTILPLKAGTFTIPPQTIRVDSNSLRTPALTLSVADAPGRLSGARPSHRAQSKPASAGELAFAELVVPKKTAYVGEVMPVLIRVGFFVRGQIVEAPMINTQGLTMQKLQVPQRAQIENINGRQCQVYTFKTAIAATRQGRFDIGPAEVDTVVVVPPPRQRSVHPRWPPDLSDTDDFFNDPFFADPFSRFGQQEKLTVRSDPVALEVKPLPPNAPPSFSGAIGNFTMTTDANPKSVQAGDPITVTSAISGRGNFDRVNAPLVEDDRGWHKYPPSSKFKQDDEVGISGTKTFETVLSPNEKKETVPVLAFSYFDPAKEQYVSLRSDPIAIAVQGGPAATQNLVASQPASPPPATANRGASAIQPTVKPRDILYQLTDQPRATESFAPIFTRPVFWGIQSIPLLALISFAVWKIRRARIDNREARRIHALQHEAAELTHKLRRNDAPPRQYYAEASRVVRVKTALASSSGGIDPNMVDAETAANTFKLNSDSRDQLRRLFEQSDEWQYSGAHNGPARISPENRREVLELIENLK